MVFFLHGAIGSIFYKMKLGVLYELLSLALLQGLTVIETAKCYFYCRNPGATFPS